MRERELQREVAETVESRLPDVEVLAVELGGPERMSVYIDRPGGVDLALCEQVSSVLRPYTERFSLDVSSPGFERPLRTPQHFAERGRSAGRASAPRTTCRAASASRDEIVTAGDDAVTLATGDGEFDVPYDEIVRGNLIDEG